MTTFTRQRLETVRSKFEPEINVSEERRDAQGRKGHGRTGDPKVVHARLLVCHGVARDIACSVGKVQCAVGHSGQKKGRNARARQGTRIHSNEGGEDEIEAARRKPAQGLVILRYHVYYVSQYRYCICVGICMLVHVHVVCETRVHVYTYTYK